MDWIGSFAFNVSAFIIILSVIVFVHEYGHYIVAKWNHVKVEVFSIGFGKEIFGWNDRSGTRWKVSILPFGGYVKMFGDVNPASAPDKEVLDEMSESDKKIAFHYQSLLAKTAIVSAGPLMNFIFGIIVLTLLFTAYGKMEALPVVGKIVENSAAESAGLQTGDRIIEIDGTRIRNFGDIQRVVSLSADIPLQFQIERESKPLILVITPTLSEQKDMFGNVIRVGLVGIGSEGVSYKKLSVVDAFNESIYQTYAISASTLKALGQMITGRRGIDDLSGPIRIAKYSGQTAEKALNGAGFSLVLWFMALISINLGLVNLFPIPLLDGGHLFYYLIEAIRGKPLAEKFQQYGFRAGLAFILILTLVVTANDIRQLVFP